MRIKKYLVGATLLPLIPPNLSSLASTPSFDKIDLSGIMKAGSGGMGGLNIMNLLKSNIKPGLGMIGTTLNNVLPTKDKNVNATDASMKNLRGNVWNGMMSSGNPWIMAAGALNMGIDKLGGFSDASEDLGKGIDFGNKVASLALPGAGWFTKRTRDYEVSDELKQSGDMYAGVLDFANLAAKNAGAKLVFGSSKQNARAEKAKLWDTLAQNVVTENEIAQAGASNPFISTRNYNKLNGGVKFTSSGKNGMKFDLDEINRILSKRAVTKLENGGKMNVIPTGALHAHRHHMEKVDEAYEDLTNKGIPVVTEEKGGLVLQAEIERNEIIFTLEVTLKLEKLMEEGTDEAAIEAGKLLVYEILENTIDNTGLLKEIK